MFEFDDDFVVNSHPIDYYDSDDSDDSDNDYYDKNYDSRDSQCVKNYGQMNLKKLKSLREKFNWEIEEERHEFLNELCPLTRQWKGLFPNLRKIFRREEIDWLLAESVSQKLTFLNCYKLKLRERFVYFVINTGYKDEPEVDVDGEPILRRTTAVHCAARLDWQSLIIPKLFEIYDRFDVNCIDEFGVTHFHIACKYGCDEVVKKFLELGQDPNCFARESVDPPLHLAIAGNQTKVIELLLKSGADPNLSDSNGWTPLHIICKRKRRYDDSLAKLFFEINDEKHQTLLVDAQDKLGRTPLQCAVANVLPDMIDLLLDHGADLFSFVFPLKNHFFEFIPSSQIGIRICKYKVASAALVVIEHLERRGYLLDKSDALTIMQLFVKYRLIYKSVDIQQILFSDESVNINKIRCSDKSVDINEIRQNQYFVREAKKLMLRPSLSLYDFIRMRREQAMKLFTINDLVSFPHKYRHKTYHAYVCELILRKFCRRWALEYFLSLTGYQLPILCCEHIIDLLINVDLIRICVAARLKPRMN